MEIVVAVDVDECLLKWLPSFERYVSLREWKVAQTSSYNLLERFPGQTYATLDRMIDQFHRSYEYERLPEMPHASETLQVLKDEFPHVTFVAVTACGREPKTLQARAWQLRNFPIDRCIAVDIRGSKANAYNQLQPDIVIDDHLDHLTAAASMGMTPIVFDQPWNTSCDFPRILSWKHAGELLKPYFQREANQ